jgi:hypothetical protein
MVSDRSLWDEILNLLGYALVLLLLPIIVCGGQMAYETVSNSVKLYYFGKDLFEYPLPLRTDEVERQSEIGVLEGNSNHCDYLAERGLVTQLTRDEIEAYFQNVEAEILVDKESMPDGRLRVILRRFKFGYPPGWDIRCH